MRIKFLCIIACLFSLSLTAQDLKYLERDLANTVITELDSIKMKAERIFQYDPLNETATYYLVESYRYTNNDSLVPEFFRKIKSDNPENPIPYLLAAKYQYTDFSLNDTLRLAELKEAHRLDPQKFVTNYLLGMSYYELFHEKFSADSNSYPGYFALKANQHFISATQIDSSSIEYFKYPIIQLSEFLGDKKTVVKYSQIHVLPRVNKENIPIDGQFYFPVNRFIELDDHWKTKYKTDVFRAMEIATFRLSWYSSYLNAMQEPLLYNLSQDTIYRFTWLRSFDPPVAIRLQKQNDKIILFWKMADGAGGYLPGELIVNDKKELTPEEWMNFQKLINQCDFWNMPAQQKTFGCDGAQWIIEAVVNGQYKVVDRWSPRNSDFQKLGKFMIDLTSLNIPDNDIY